MEMDVLPFAILFLPDTGFFTGRSGVVTMLINGLDDTDISDEGDFSHDGDHR